MADNSFTIEVEPNLDPNTVRLTDDWELRFLTDQPFQYGTQPEATYDIEVYVGSMLPQ